MPIQLSFMRSSAEKTDFDEVRHFFGKASEEKAAAYPREVIYHVVSAQDRHHNPRVGDAEKDPEQKSTSSEFRIWVSLVEHPGEVAENHAVADMATIVYIIHVVPGDQNRVQAREVPITTSRLPESQPVVLNE
mmetsp:Transcript_22230/g.29756  ORF Transcript_22230/g.29756 Transcript_22230/m.29756 type:complete len:133 (-) Transcript_22230:338-736(-)|eukprot:Macronucleus_2859.p2 GENE.Macronucleus_2859~~Macronucleus_2859.p2  ORF type:complete len:133 (-),score=0.37 Macronucleus_2859:124-522(-)